MNNVTEKFINLIKIQDIKCEFFCKQEISKKDYYIDDYEDCYEPPTKKIKLEEELIKT